MTERSPVEFLQHLARQRDDREPLLLRGHDACPGGRISHLPISPSLAEAWIKLTSAPFRPHQSLALSAMRRGESLALVGERVATSQTLHLLMYERLLNETNARALLLLPDDVSALHHIVELDQLNRAITTPLSHTHVGCTTVARDVSGMTILTTTPMVLHRRLLRHHDRAWHTFWSNLRLLLIAEVDQYHGVAAAHLSRLLLRSLRLVPHDPPPLLGVTLGEVLNGEPTLRCLSPEPWRILTVDDAPRRPTTFAIWQTPAPTELLAETAMLALAFHHEGYRVHIQCERLEIPLLTPLIAPHTDTIQMGPLSRTADIRIFAGYPSSHAMLRQSLTSESQLTIVLLGDTPAERMLRGMPESMLSAPAPAWVVPTNNAYVAAQHLLCAATERPLTTAEVAAWSADEMVARLVHHRRLVRLPDENAAWQPIPSAIEPYDYDCLWLEAEGSSVVFLHGEQGVLPGTLDPAAFDRWGFLNAALPPIRGGYRVVERDDETSTLTLVPDQNGRKTLPLRTCSVNVRDEREHRLLRNQTIGWGRVIIQEEIIGYREVQPHHSPTNHDLFPVLATRWSAPACWIDLPTRLKGTNQLIGWSLVAAFPLRALCAYTDIVPAYDAGLCRLYLIDAQPGGNGLTTWMYESLEMLLPLAYDIALDSRTDPLFEPAAYLDIEWLLPLLGSDVVPPPVVVTEAAPPVPTEPVEPVVVAETAPPVPIEPVEPMVVAETAPPVPIEPVEPVVVAETAPPVATEPVEPVVVAESVVEETATASIEPITDLDQSDPDELIQSLFRLLDEEEKESQPVAPRVEEHRTDDGEIAIEYWDDSVPEWLPSLAATTDTPSPSAAVTNAASESVDKPTTPHAESTDTALSSKSAPTTTRKRRTPKAKSTKTTETESDAATKPTSDGSRKRRTFKAHNEPAE